MQKIKEKIVWILTGIIFLGIPFVTSFFLPIFVLDIIQYILESSLSLIATQQIIEALSTLFYKDKVYLSTRDIKLQKITVIIPAYLPNEVNIIIDTINHYSSTMYDGEWNAILTYNTPIELEIEKEIKILCEKFDWFECVKVEGSTSKAQNINYVLDNCESSLGDIIGIFDADHHPQSDSFDRVNVWLGVEGYDYVQGRCMIRDEDFGLVESLVKYNFDIMYGVHHKARRIMWDFAVFGGTNGYWKTEIIKDIKFDENFLTEDIDSTLRTILQGHKGIYDRKLISTEESPPNFNDLCKQRVRWAQGWFEVTYTYTHKILFSKKIKFRSKIVLFFLLPWREFFSYLNMWGFPVMVAKIHNNGFYFLSNYFSIITSIYCFLLYPIVALCIHISSNEEWFKRKKLLIAVCLLNFVYQWWERVVSIYAHSRSFLRLNNWVTTQRKKNLKF